MPSLCFVQAADSTECFPEPVLNHHIVLPFKDMTLGAHLRCCICFSTPEGKTVCSLLQRQPGLEALCLCYHLHTRAKRNKNVHLEVQQACFFSLKITDSSNKGLWSTRSIKCCNQIFELHHFKKRKTRMGAKKVNKRNRG